MQKVTHDGIRTRNLWIRSPTRYPIAPHGLNLHAARAKNMPHGIMIAYDQSLVIHCGT